MEEKEEYNKYEINNNKNNSIYNNLDNKKVIIKKNKYSSLPKNLFKKTNKLQLNYNSSSDINSNYLESNYGHNNYIINKLNKKNYNINNKNQKNTALNKNHHFSSFYNLLLDFIKQDNILEDIRQSLSFQEDVNLADLFEFFDRSSNNLISSNDFLQALKELGLYLTKEEIKYLFRKFNKNLNEYFEFDEFCDIFLPRKKSNSKIISESQSNENYYEISEETKNIICKLFKNIIDGEKSIENYRKIVGKNREYSGFDLFNKIKKSYSIGIYKEDIANYMKQKKYELSNGELEFLMERFDKNKDGMIDYKEFLNEITPIDD